MDDVISERKRRGACQCGACAFEIRERPLLVLACHCLDCQRMSAGAFSLSMLLPAGAFVLTQDATTSYVKQSANGRTTTQVFCAVCHTWLYSLAAGMEDFIAVRPTTLADHSWVKPIVQMWTVRRRGEVSLQTKFSFEGDLDGREFGSLLAAYSAESEEIGAIK